ncbi:MAG: autoinducer binding domain-containing protein [Glaciimonas sp.]|jgi:LuxR family quorum-sensing system transcriptional regulator SolR|nr:autoinducer binding domain-containing protein [Glaciimonas sp.]
MEKWKEDDFQALSKKLSEQEFFDYFSVKSAEIGFEFCSFGMLLPLPLNNQKFIIHNNYPARWWQTYQDKNYLSVDPTVRHALSSVEPILRNEKTYAAVPEIREEAREHGMIYGWAQPARDIRGTIGMVSLIRSVEEVDAAELDRYQARMQHIAQLLLLGMTGLILPKALPESTAQLNVREREVMRWTAEGKTSYEIGRILIISTGTVNYHINNAVRKLNAVNKIQAVVKAALLGLL